VSLDKILIVIRGLPGSGKSSFALAISEEGKYPVYCIDDYFTDSKTGIYQFDHSLNHKAYALCLENTEKSMSAKQTKIIVENVFSFEWEMEPYFKLAASYGYQVHVLTMETRHEGHHNIHGISEEQVRKIAEKFKVKLI
jgi:predicted kinase